MDYLTINRAIFNGKDLGSSFKNKEFYQYLLDNNVAYYYAKSICKKKGGTEKEILSIGDTFNEKYLKTLEFIYKISKQQSIEFLLFKTFKDVTEVVDGDIDLFVKKKDFGKFFKALQANGFTCIQETSLKASCVKNGFCKIEPRVTVAFHGKTIFGESAVWKYGERVQIHNLPILKTSTQFDVCFFLLNSLYGPNYIKLYHYLLLRKIDHKKVSSIVKDEDIKRDLQMSLKCIMNGSIFEKRFPLFIDNLSFMLWWFRRVLFDGDIKVMLKIKNLVFFLYAKYGYMFFGRLPFRHEWGIIYG